MEVQDSEKLLAMLQKRKWHGSATRLNVAGPDAETYVHKSGRKLLVEPVLSDVVKSGPLFRLVKAQLPFAEQVTLNKNLLCARHRGAECLHQVVVRILPAWEVLHMH